MAIYAPKIVFFEKMKNDLFAPNSILT